MRSLACPARPRALLTLSGGGPVSDLMWVAVRAGQDDRWEHELPERLAAVEALLPERNTHASLSEGPVAAAAAIRTALRNASRTTDEPGDPSGRAARRREEIASRFRPTLDRLDADVDEIATLRLDEARRRLTRRDRPGRRECSWAEGLTGIGAYLLHRDKPENDRILKALLQHLVDLTRPLTRDGQTRPGWWLADRHDPADGGADLGVADGCGGVLALLSLAAADGVRVRGHLEAIRTLAGAYRVHQQRDSDGVPWWPLHVTRPDPHRMDALTDRPDSSWSGTLGIARALQLAALVLGDRALRRDAAASALAALREAVFCAPGLRRGPHGAAITALRMARAEPGYRRQLEEAADALLRTACELTTSAEEGGFLDGSAGLLASRPPNRFQPALPPRAAAQWDWVLLTTS